MLYATNYFRILEKANVAVEENPDDIPDLVAHFLCHFVERRIKRHLSYGYQSREAVLCRVRGRIDLLNTERHRLLDRGKIACRFDELTIDTTINRYIRDALETISNIVRSCPLAKQCRSLMTYLRRMGVTGKLPNHREVPIDFFGMHDADDRSMIDAAHLAFNLALPTESHGTRHLSLPNREDTWIRHLYEKGIAGFYKVVLSKSEWRVKASQKFQFQIESQSQGIGNVLPCMEADIILDNKSKLRRIVIDTKFKSVIITGRFREILESRNIYQIYTYLRSQEGNGDPLSDNASGLLLHPSVDIMLNEAAVIQNHEIRFATVNLGATAKEIRKQLLLVLGLCSDGKFYFEEPT
jgi:5-methylcytosine-specific restriction enzyme subunit McrC